MKVVDARSGEVLSVGSVVRYPGGEWTRLDAVEPGLFRAHATITRRYQNHATGQMAIDTIRTPLTVRWMHPGFLFQHVGFINS